MVDGITDQLKALNHPADVDALDTMINITHDMIIAFPKTNRSVKKTKLK
jgi:hypothetical protein